MRASTTLASGSSSTAAGCMVCPVCASANLRQFASGDKDQSRDIHREFRFFLCQTCRLRFQEVDNVEASRMYSDIQELAPRARASARRELRCEAHVLAALRRIAPGNRLLDVGSGDGWMLRAAKQTGWDCAGVDVSAKLAEVAERRSCVRVLVGDLPSLGLGPDSFDVINLDQVLMYVPEPVKLIMEVTRLLRVGGICRIREYDVDSFSARRAGARYWMYAPTHVLAWSRSAVAVLASVCGLRVTRVIPGTEASLGDWLAAERHQSLGTAARVALQFAVRKARLPGMSVGADVAYYLQKGAS